MMRARANTTAAAPPTGSQETKRRITFDAPVISGGGSAQSRRRPAYPRRVLHNSTPRSQELRSRFAALSDRTFPAGKPAKTLGELTAQHLDYLRPKFFEGGRFNGGPGKPRPVPLQLDREAFEQALRPVLQLPQHDSLLQLFSHMETMSGGGGVAWNSLLTFVRESVEGTGLGTNEKSQDTCKYYSTKIGDQLDLAGGMVQRIGAKKKCYLTLVGAIDLAIADDNTGSSDPTALVFWNGEKVYESSTKFGSTRAMWRETVILILPEDPAAQNQLCIEIYDRDAGTVYGDFLGRLLLVGPGPAGITVGKRTLAFKLQPDPLKDDNSFVQGVLAIQVDDEDPATAYSVPEYVNLVDEIEISREGTLAATGITESITSTIGRAEQLRSQGHSWDRVVTVLEHEFNSRAQHGSIPDDQRLWWQSERKPHNEVMGVPKFLMPSTLPDEDGRRTVGCKAHSMVDKIGILDQYDCYFTACRGGTVQLWDAATMQPANPPTVEPPYASNRPSLLDLNRDYYMMRRLQDVEAELRMMRVSELRRRAESVGVEEKLIERKLDQARLESMAKERKRSEAVTALTPVEQDAEKISRREKEKRALIRLILDHVKNHTIPEAELNYGRSAPGMLHQRANPRGLTKHRQSWVLDAATLQSPEGWSDRKFYREVQSNYGHGSTGNGNAISLKGMGIARKKSSGVAPGANNGATGMQHFSMQVASPPKINPVVFICADNTIRLWSRRMAHGYDSTPGEQEGYWCKQRPEAGPGNAGHIKLSERGKAVDLALQLDCIPTCIARAKPGAIVATWSDVENTWSYVPRIVVGTSDGTICTWRVSWDGEYYHIDEPGSPETSVNRFHDGAVLTCLRATESYIVSGGQDCGVVLGDHHRWEPIWTAREHTEGVSCMDFDIRGKTFVSGGDDRLVALWDVGVGPKSIATLPKSYGAPVVGVSFSDGHPYLLSVAYSNQTVQLWDTRKTPTCLQEAVDYSTHFAPSAVSDTGKYTASCFDQVSHSMVCAGSHAVAWQIRPKQPRLWKRHWRHIVRLVLVFLRWYVRHRKKQVLHTHSAAVLLVEFVQKLDSIITVDVNGVIHLWDVDVAISADEDGPHSFIAEFNAFGTRIGGDTPLVERLTAAIVLPSSAGSSAGDLMTASQTGKLAVHSMTTSTIESLTLGVSETRDRSDSVTLFDVADEDSDGCWDGVPCEVLEMSFTAGLQGALRNRPILLLGHDGTVWLCPCQKIEDALGRTTLAKPLQLIQNPALPNNLTGLPSYGNREELPNAPVVSTVCAYETRNVGGGPVVLVGCRVGNKAGEAVIRAYDRSAVNRPTFLIEPFSTPPQPDPFPQSFGDHRTCEYRYNPELHRTIFIPPEGNASERHDGQWVTPHERAYQSGLLLVVRKDGVMHAVDMHSKTTVHSFAVNLGGSPALDSGSWEVNERLLICGNMDGFARILYIAGGPQTAEKCMKEAAAKGKRGGVVNVRHTWRAHTSQITQIKVVHRGELHKPWFCSAAADGSVKLWGLDGSPVASLGMTARDEMVQLVSARLEKSAGLAHAARRLNATNAGSIPAPNTAQSSDLMISLVEQVVNLTGDHVDRQHQPRPPPARRVRKAGRIAKLTEYVETGEAAIRKTAKSYRMEAAGRAAASSRRASALAGPGQGQPY